MRSVSVFSNYAALAIAISSMALWQIYGGYFPPYGPRMRFNGALIIFVLACAKLLLDNRRHRSLGVFAAAAGIAFAFATLIQDLCGLDFHIDNFFIRDLTDLGSRFRPGRMAPSSSSSYMMIGIALLLYQIKGVYVRIAQFLCLFAGAISIAAFFGYMFGARGLYQFSHYMQLSPYSASAILLLSFSAIASKPDLGFLKLVRGDRPSAAFARHMLLATVVFPPTLGFLFMVAEDRHYFPSETAAALVAVVTVFFFFLVIWHSAEAMSWSENALGESENQFRTLANEIPQLSWVADSEGNLIWFNQRWHDFIGEADFQSNVWRWGPASFQHPEHVAAISASWMDAVASGRPWELTFPLRSKEGPYRWFLARAHPIYNLNGKLLRWFGSNTDIDERRRFEEELKSAKLKAERASEAKSLFLANMSHEIRSPLAAVIGFTNILRAENLDREDRDKFMRIIERNSKSLLRLIDDILDLSKVEADKIILESGNLNLSEFLEDLAAAMNLRAQSKGIQFRLTIDGRLPHHIVTDVLRLRQILSNLIGNSIKFTSAGHVELKVRAEAAVLIFTVTDTGIGISPENVQKLFKAFSQADASFSRRYGGSGLGLVLAQRLAKLLGGDLKLLSTRDDVGSVFEARIANVETTVAERVSPTDERGLMRVNLASKKILIVEDSPDNQILISTYLKGSGASLVFADDGAEGIEKAMNQNPDLILMDIQMPKLDGNSAIKQLRAIGFNKPIVALSAHAMAEEKDKSFAAGCTDYLTKPVGQKHLLETILRWASRPESLNIAGSEVLTAGPTQHQIQ